jgi:hypothetical protein
MSLADRSNGVPAPSPRKQPPQQQQRQQQREREGRGGGGGGSRGASSSAAADAAAVAASAAAAAAVVSAEMAQLPALGGLLRTLCIRMGGAGAAPSCPNVSRAKRGVERAFAPIDQVELMRDLRRGIVLPEILQQLVRPVVEVDVPEGSHDGEIDMAGDGDGDYDGGSDGGSGRGRLRMMAAAAAAATAAASSAASQDSIAKLLLSLPSLQRELTDLLLEQIPAMQCVVVWRASSSGFLGRRVVTSALLMSFVDLWRPTSCVWSCAGRFSEANHESTLEAARALVGGLLRLRSSSWCACACAFYVSPFFFAAAMRGRYSGSGGGSSAAASAREPAAATAATAAAAIAGGGVNAAVMMVNLPKLILSVFRWTDFPLDCEHLAGKLLEVMDACEADVRKKEAIASDARMHARTHTHTHANTHTHTHTHARTHTRAHAHAHAHTRTHAHVNTHTQQPRFDVPRFEFPRSFLFVRAPRPRD